MSGFQLSDPARRATGLSTERVRALELAANACLAEVSPETTGHHRMTERWNAIQRLLFERQAPFEFHEELFECVYRQWPATNGPPPVWSPDTECIARTNIAQFMSERGIQDYPAFHAWSVSDRQSFWAQVTHKLGILFQKPADSVLSMPHGPASARWFLGAKLNIADSCFGAPQQKTAIIHQDEGAEPQTMTYGQLNRLTARIANGLNDMQLAPGDAIAIDMPMTAESVAIYLGIIRAGCCAVSIADSFAPHEIATRLNISKAKAVFTVDHYLRRGKRIEIYPKVKDAADLPAIVLTSGPTASSRAQLRQGDLLWDDFLSDNDAFDSLPASPDAHTNILFSSGTTGEPKAIPWNHTTPIKCAMDACLHHDITPDAVVAWPTNLGWMMGPWLIYASLVNRATMALYTGAPTDRGFGLFVQHAGVTMLGVVPSLVKVWRESACMEPLDWSCIRSFGSTGECSNPSDMHYLMFLAGNKPIIEYCGGTEIGGGHLTGTLLQPCSPATFSTPALGIDLLILDQDGTPADNGEIFLLPPSVGLSGELLNRKNHEVYYKDCPTGPNGETLRRHGDQVERLGAGYFRAHGRADDTMNLGGIKVSSAEIERTLCTLDSVGECAAIAATPPGGGPSNLVIFAVPAPQAQIVAAELPQQMQQTINRQLNPLFRIHDVIVVDSLPRTASNKVMRRELRRQYDRRTDNPPHGPPQ